MGSNNTNAAERLDGRLFWEQAVRCKYWVVLVLVVCTFGGFLYTKITYQQEYVSSAKLFVHDKTNETSTSEIYTANHLSKDYAEIITSRTTLEQVIREAGLTDWSTGKLNKCVRLVTSEETSRIIDMKVTTNDPNLSKKIAQTLCEVSQERIAQIFTKGNGIAESGPEYGIDIIDPAGKSIKASSPLKKNLLYGFFIGAVASVALVLLRYRLDDKIKGEEDITRYLNLTVLAEIPYSDTAVSTKTGHRKHG